MSLTNNNLQVTDQQFPLPYNAYAAFDAVTLKQLMLQRLNESSTFTDQIYEGSNFNSFIDVIAYSYNVLLYYLNKTSSESLFATSQIYENMNKIVKVLNYNPIGHQSSFLKFNATAGINLQPGIYTVPKYSYFSINDIRYSFTKDSTFVKSSTGVQDLTVFSEESYLVQGEFVEYPIYSATGQPFENFTLTIINTENENEIIDHNGIDVYVRNELGVWEEWTRVDSLFLANGNDKVYECRLNENMRYNIKFGNSITGKQLKEGDIVSVYYLRSDGSLGQVGPNTLNSSKLFIFDTANYNKILQDIRPQGLRLLTFSEANNVSFINKSASSSYSSPESTPQIRQNAPNIFKAQGRLVTTKDFESFIMANYKNLISDVKVVNNWDYLDGHMKYLYNIGLASPSLDSRVLYNQVKFADSCNFNDIYIYVVPRIFTRNSLTEDASYLNITAKQSIIDGLMPSKMTTIEPIIQDPVYIGVGFGLIQQTNSSETVGSILKDTKLVIKKINTTLTNNTTLKQKVYDVIINYFLPDKVKLGMLVDLSRLSNEILSLEGVGGLYTTREISDNLTLTSESLSLVLFNPVYDQIDEDVTAINQNTLLPYFKIPYIHNSDQLLENIIIADSDFIESGAQEY
jgi:hypothetical protein